MSIDDKRIIFKHLRANKGRHIPSCSKRWFNKRGLSWKHFCRYGYTVKDFRLSCGAEVDEELEQLIDFIEDNNLWDKGKLDVWIETKTPT
jgi:hypothetical protein